MVLELDPNSRTPLYRQITDQLKGLIERGALPTGERLPPTRELATRLSVHRTTVANAYAELEADGMISGHVGRGTFVTGGVDGKASKPAPEPFVARLENQHVWSVVFADARAEEPLEALCQVLGHAHQDGQVIPFAIASPCSETFPVEEFRRATNEVLKREGRQLLQFGPSDGYPSLKEYLLEELDQEGIRVGFDELMVTNGGQQALDLARRVFVRPGDSVILENPTYPGMVQTFNLEGINCLSLPVNESGWNLDVLESLLSQHRVRLIVLTPAFQNPIGISMSLPDRRRLLHLAARHQVPIVEDNIYGRLRLSGQDIPTLKSLDEHGLVIHTNSFSKMGFPGLRVGWVVASQPVIERMRMVKQAVDLHTDQLAQAALAEFGRRGGVERMLKRSKEVYRRKLAHMLKALEEHFPRQANWTEPEGGLTLWVRLPEGIDTQALLVRAREKNVLFAPGRYFYLQNAESNTMRLGFSGPSRQQIEDGIGILGGLIRREMGNRRRESNGWRGSARVALV